MSEFTTLDELLESIEYEEKINNTKISYDNIADTKKINNDICSLTLLSILSEAEKNKNDLDANALLSSNDSKPPINLDSSSDKDNNTDAITTDDNSTNSDDTENTDVTNDDNLNDSSTNNTDMTEISKTTYTKAYKELVSNKFIESLNNLDDMKKTLDDGLKNISIISDSKTVYKQYVLLTVAKMELDKMIDNSKIVLNNYFDYDTNKILELTANIDARLKCIISMINNSITVIDKLNKLNKST